MRCPNCKSPTMEATCQVFASIDLIDGREPQPLEAKAGAHDAVDFFVSLSCAICNLTLDQDGAVLIDGEFVTNRFDQKVVDDLYELALRGVRAIGTVDFVASKVND